MYHNLFINKYGDNIGRETILYLIFKKGLMDYKL